MCLIIWIQQHQIGRKNNNNDNTRVLYIFLLLSAGEPAVGVQPGAKQVHADVTDPHDDEPERADFRAFVFGFFGDQARVQIGGVGEPGD